MKCEYCGKEFTERPTRPYSDGFCSWECKYGHKQLTILKNMGIKLPDGYIDPADLPLTDEQESFCEAYIETRSPYRAYKASYNTNGLSLGEIRKRGKFISKLPFIKRRVKELIEEYRNALAPAALNVLEQFSIIANSDIREYYDEGGRLIDPSEWSYEMGMACKKVVRKFNKDGMLTEESIELHDKIKALSAMAKIEKMYQDTMQVNINHTITAQVKQFGENDIVAKLVNEELKQIESIADKEVIEVEPDEQD